MSNETYAGDMNARTDGDAPTNKKTDVCISDGGSKRLIDLPDYNRDILLVLAYSGPTHGRGVAKHLGNLRKEHINDGGFYPKINALVDDGFIEKRENEHDRRSHEYALSERGREVIREHAQRIAGALEAIDGGAR